MQHQPMYYPQQQQQYWNLPIGESLQQSLQQPQGTVVRQAAPKPGQQGSDQSSYGSFKIAFLPKVMGLGIVLTCLFSYFMAQKKQQAPAFPNCSITETAMHYPQSVVYRLNMLMVAGASIIFWYIIYSWLQFLSRKYDYSSTERIYLTIAQIGSAFFALATATIDTGYMNMSLHNDFGVIFFAIWLVSILFFSYKIYLFQKKFSIISQISLILKAVSIVALVLTFVVNILVQLNPSMASENSNISQLVNTIEWQVAFEIALWIFSFTFDWDATYFNFDGPSISLVSFDVFQKRYDSYANYNSGSSNGSTVESSA